MTNFSFMLLAAAQSELASAKDASAASANRSHLFVTTALHLGQLFAANPEMADFQMTCVLRVEDTLEGPERVVKLRRHLKAVAPGCLELQTKDGKAEFFHASTPFWLMGDGTFSMSRAHPRLQALLSAEADSAAMRAQAFALALEIDVAFQPIRLDHYLGAVL
jgi:hypothetical protein